MTDTAPAERAMPANVIQALARVIEEMPAVAKDAQYSGGGSGTYSYRSIEAVTAAAQHLLGKYGLVPAPRVVSRRTIEVTVGGKPWTQDELEMVYRFYGPGGVEDFIDVGPVWGLGRDNSDKGTNKASTQAYKVALVQLLCIGDSRHDADSERAETDSRSAGPPPPKTEGWESAEQEAQAHKDIHHRLSQLPEDHPVRIAGRVMREKHGWPVALERLAELRNLLDEAERTPAPGGNDEKAPSAPEPTDTPEAPIAPLPGPEKPTEPEDAETARKAAIVAHVNAMTPAVLTDYLELRAMDIEGTPKARKERLAKALVAEGWKPF